MKVNRLNAAVSREAGPRPGSAGAGRKGPGWGGCGREPGEAGRPSGEPLPALSLVGHALHSRVHGHMQSRRGLIRTATAERAAAATAAPATPPDLSSAGTLAL